MKKTSKQIANEERIRAMMNDAGIYEGRYELQIEQTADTLCEIDEIKAIIKKEGRTVMEMKTGGLGMKQAAHPLYGQLNNLNGLLIRQYASLGLNKLSEKKSDTKQAKTENDPMGEYFGTVR